MKTKKTLAILFALGVVFLFGCGKSSKTDTLKLIPVESGGKWGFVDKDGKYVVNPQFQSVSFFSEGMAAVENTDNKWGYIDETGAIIINPQYKQASSFSEELACVVVEGGMPQYIDSKGEMKFQIDAELAGDFHNGLAPVKIKEKWGYIDKTGTIKINAQFDNASMFSGDLAAVCTIDKKDSTSYFGEQKWGFIDAEGKITITQQFKAVMPFSCSLAAATLDNKQWGFIDNTGKFIINPQFDMVLPFFNDIAAVKQGKQWGYIDKTGKIIINPQFDAVLPFSSDMIAVKSSDKWGYIDNTGKYIINPQFDAATSFYGKIAIVKSSDKYGIIDKEGKYLVNPQFDKTLGTDAYFSFLLYGVSVQLTESDKTPPTDQVATKFLECINKKEFTEAKKLATTESAAAIDMLESFSKMGGSEVKETVIKDMKCKEDGDKAACNYTENGEAKKLDLVKKDNEWLVEMKKESPDMTEPTNENNN